MRSSYSIIKVTCLERLRIRHYSCICIWEMFPDILGFNRHFRFPWKRKNFEVRRIFSWLYGVGLKDKASLLGLF